MEGPSSSLNIENVVGSTSIGQELDIERLSEDLEGSSYDPDTFPGLVHRTRDPTATGLVFRSGNIVFTGAKSIEELEQAASLTIRRLSNLGIDVADVPDLTIQNVVSSGDLGTELDLDAIAIGLGLGNIEYEPEQFPGLVYRPPEHGVVALLFASGKVILSGATHLQEAEMTMESIRGELSNIELL